MKLRIHLRTEVLVSIVLIIVLGGLNYADQAALAPLIPLITEDLGVSDPAMGLVCSIYTVLMGISMLVFGYLSDKYSRKKLMLIGALLWSAFAYGTSLAGSFYSLLVVRAFTGIGLGSFFPIAFAMVADYFPPKERGKVYAWLGILPGVGGAAGGALGALYGPTLGWRFPFRVIGLAGFIAVALFYFLLKEPERAAAEPEFKDLIEKGEVKYEYRISIEDIKQVLQKRSNIFIILQSIPGCVPWGILNIWLITFFHRTAGMPILLATVFSVAFWIGCALGTLLGGYLGDKLERRYRTGRISLSIFGISAGMLLLLAAISCDLPPYTGPQEGEFFPLIWQFVWDYLWWKPAGWIFDLYFFGGVLAGIAYPNTYAMVQNLNLPEIRGTLNALNLSTDLLGRGVGPVIGGILIEAEGIKNGLMIGVLFWILCVALWPPLYKTKPRDEDETRRVLSQRAQTVSKKLESFH